MTKSGGLWMEPTVPHLAGRSSLHPRVTQRRGSPTVLFMVKYAYPNSAKLEGAFNDRVGVCIFLQRTWGPETTAG